MSVCCCMFERAFYHWTVTRARESKPTLRSCLEPGPNSLLKPSQVHNKWRPYVGISTICVNLCELPAWHLLFQLRVLFPQFHRRDFIVLGVVFWIPPAFASLLPRLRIEPALCLNDWSDNLLLVYSLGKLLDIFGW
jgi:hypothetical protein